MRTRDELKPRLDHDLVFEMNARSSTARVFSTSCLTGFTPHADAAAAFGFFLVEESIFALMRDDDNADAIASHPHAYSRA